MIKKLVWKLTNSALGDWDMAASLKGDIPRGADHETLLHGIFMISLWPIMSSPLLLQVDAELPAEARMVWYSHPRRPPLPAAILLADEKLDCIWFEGRDLPLLMHITAPSFCP